MKFSIVAYRCKNTVDSQKTGTVRKPKKVRVIEFSSFWEMGLKQQK